MLFYGCRGHKTEELKIHIDKLHEYNEVKDVAQMVLGRLGEHYVVHCLVNSMFHLSATPTLSYRYLAVYHGVTTKEMYRRYNLDVND